MSERILLTAQEAAEFLGFPLDSVEEFTRTGQIPCIRVGETVLYHPASLGTWAQQIADAAWDSLPLAPTPSQRADGRWSVHLSCPDGRVRRFVSTRHGETIQPEYQRTPRTRPPLSARIRFQVLARDGFTCRYCGAKAPAVELHVDHVVPVARGGGDQLENLVASCIACNLGKGGR